MVNCYVCGKILLISEEEKIRVRKVKRENTKKHEGVVILCEKCYNNLVNDIPQIKNKE